MKNNTLKTILLTSLIICIPVVIGILLYNQLPQQIPTHFNFSGEADSYSHKNIAIFGLSAFILFINAIVIFSLKSDPKNKENQNQFMMNLAFWTCPTIALFIQPITYAIALGYKIDIAFIISLLVGILLIIIGNYLPKCKQNYTMGIRLPWTLNSEVNWNRTHRFASYLWVIGGISFIFINLIPNSTIGTIALISDLFILIIVPTVYSYILYRKGI